MPLKSCPIDEATLAEFALGEGRSRLDACASKQVVEHLAACEVCRKDYAAYVAEANKPVLPESMIDPEGKPYEPWIADSSRNVKTRFMAGMTERSREKAKLELGGRWRGRAIIAASVAAVVGAAAVFFFRTPENRAFPPSVPVPSAATSPQKNEAVAAPGETVSTKPATRDSVLPEVQQQIAELQLHVNGTESPEAALSLLGERQAQALKSPGNESGALLRWLPALYIGISERAKGTSTEGPALLALSRTYQLAGYQKEWLATFHNYAEFRGEIVRQAELERDVPSASAQAAAQRAKATAYFDEALRFYEAKDSTACLALCDRLLSKYPSSAKAYEGQIVAARCHVDNRQPEAAVECYRRIMKQCPDELFAREAAKATIRLLAGWRKTDAAIAECRQTRERFNDDDFRLYALTREAELLKSKGQSSYPEAVKVLRELIQIQPGSMYARQADSWIKAMNRQMTSGILGDPSK